MAYMKVSTAITREFDEVIKSEVYYICPAHKPFLSTHIINVLFVNQNNITKGLVIQSNLHIKQALC
jgi:hypothetical protein